ncbi:MAG: NADP-dependent oxidoreductase [Trueperaceae bacterium]|nr:NADP-dependent oxidoreductase [Trueperaceae bacterium]
MLVSRQLKLVQRPSGLFQADNFTLAEETLTELADGEILVKVIYLSLDPTQRVWAQMDSYLPAVKLGTVMRSFGLGVVVESRAEGFEKGDLVSGLTGWQTYLVAEARQLQKIPRVPDLPLDAYLGPLGMTGLTAYFGLLDVGTPKAGETLVVSAAAGAVGSMVCQMGKLKGLRVIGTTGTEAKCQWLQDELGVDQVINYKEQNVYRALRKAAPEGIDIFFDNVGGEMLDTVLTQINIGARIPLCGYISAYAANEVPGIKNLSVLISKRAKIQGFLVSDYYPRAAEAFTEMAGWLKAGKLHYRSDIYEGLETAPDVINKLFTGENTGKLLIKLADA